MRSRERIKTATNEFGICHQEVQTNNKHWLRELCVKHQASTRTDHSIVLNAVASAHQLVDLMFGKRCMTLFYS